MRTLSRLTLLSLSAVFISTLTACARDLGPSGRQIDRALAEHTGQNGRVCVRTSDINGYAFDDHVIKIPARGQRYYLATTFHSCPDLDFSALVVFDSLGFETCGGRSAIITETMRCPLASMYEFRNRKEAFAALDAVKQKLADEMAKEKAAEEANEAPET